MCFLFCFDWREWMMNSADWAQIAHRAVNGDKVFPLRLLRQWLRWHEGERKKTDGGGKRQHENKINSRENNTT